MKTKYFIEIVSNKDDYTQVIQSILFNTQEKAVKWANCIDFLDMDTYEIWLMTADCDNGGNIIGDIDRVEDITKKILRY